MTATAGSQLFGLWYDILSAVLMSGLFFYLAFAAPTFPLHVQKRIPAFLSKRVWVALGICAAGTAFFKAADLPAPSQEIPVATVAAFGAAPEWDVIYTGSEGDTLSIDRKTIARNGNMVGYSQQLVFKTPKPYPMPAGTVASAKARLLVNCAERTRVMQEFVMVRSDGSTFFQDKSATPPVLPLSTDPSRPEYISSNYMCGARQ
jgi:hypothetical protein